MGLCVVSSTEQEKIRKANDVGKNLPSVGSRLGPKVPAEIARFV